MKTWLIAAAMSLAVAAGAIVPAAWAEEGPRASSEHNWPGMMDPAASQIATVPQAAAPVAVAPQPVAGAPHYVWQEGYDHGGRWHGKWVLVQ